MSKGKLLKDNVITFIGGNFANALSYSLNIALSRHDAYLFSLYTAYYSILLILQAPSLVSMRVFTVFGNPVIENIRRYYLRNKNSSIFIMIVCISLLIPADLILTQITLNGTIVNSFLLILIAFISIVVNIFRGIRQHEENYKRAVLSLNIETMGRLVLGYFFAVVLNLNILGIFIGHIIGLTCSLFVCFEFSHIYGAIKHNDEIRLKSIFLSSLILTFGLEFFANYDIIFSNNVLQSNLSDLAEYNTLQFFRKIIFFGVFSVSSIILSLGGKGKHSKRFMFIYTLATGLVIGIGAGSFFFIIQNLILAILKQHFSVINPTLELLFLCGTVLMSASYLLVNWLFSTKKKAYVLVPVIASVIQLTIFFIIGKDLVSLIYAFIVSSVIFFIITFLVGLYEVYSSNKLNYDRI